MFYIVYFTNRRFPSFNGVGSIGTVLKSAYSSHSFELIWITILIHFIIWIVNLYSFTIRDKCLFITKKSISANFWTCALGSPIWLICKSWIVNDYIYIHRTIYVYIYTPCLHQLIGWCRNKSEILFTPRTGWFMKKIIWRNGPVLLL